MSRLHEMKIKHRGMSPVEKMSCNCDLCKGLNVDRTKRKSDVPESNIEDIIQKIESKTTEEQNSK